MDLSRQQKEYLKIIQDLHKKWKPHNGQAIIIKELAEGRQSLFVQCGRKFGKSELAIYLLWRRALLYPNSACYYLAPQLKQAKEIIWAARRIQNFCSDIYIDSIDNSELRIRFKNGSFIKIDGSDNFESYRGITPDFVVYDEFKDFRPEFHEAMAPNLAVKKAPLIIIGTPPKPRARNYRQYINLADEMKVDEECFWIKRTSYDNPHIDPKWLDKERDKLIGRDEEDVWKREYLAEIVGGGRHCLFPMFNRETHLKDPDSIIQDMKKEFKNYEFFVVTRPSATTCFAALFCAIHKNKRNIIVLDELYEQNKSEMSSEKMGNKISSICLKISSKAEWIRATTEKTEWFSEETMVRFGEYYIPCKNKGEEGLSLLKDVLSHNLIRISKKCENLVWEMENYTLDDKNRLPKEFDYVIECLKVLFSVSYYSTVEIVEIIRTRAIETEGRYLSPHHDWDKIEQDTDWTKHSSKIFKS